MFFLALLSLALPQSERLTLEPHALHTGSGIVEAELGRLRVPACHDEPDGALVELAFVRFQSTAAEPGPPIVYLAGGPGTSGIATARGPRLPLFQALRAVADVIALDQRGVGLSRPQLVCQHTWELSFDRPFEHEEALRVTSERVAACREHYAADGIDLGCYDTHASVADLDLLRRALGAEAISLWGISYGTHLALAALRRYPERIHRAVLAGVEGPAHTVKLPSQIDANLERIAAHVARDPVLSERIPDLVELVRSVFEELEREPAVVQTGGRRLVIGKADIQLATARAMGSQRAILAMPSLFLRMAEGDFEALAPLVAQTRRGTTGSAMRWAMDCASGVSEERLRRIEEEARGSLFGGWIDFPLPSVCDAWGVEPLPASFRAAVTAENPVLFISGTLDGRTPPSNAEEVRRGFPNSAHLVLDGAAHSDALFLSSPLILERIHAFLAGETVPSETLELPPLEFVVPD